MKGYLHKVVYNKDKYKFDPFTYRLECRGCNEVFEPERWEDDGFKHECSKKNKEVL